RPHQTASNSRSGRHETGSAIQRLMSDSCQPLPLTLILICGGERALGDLAVDGGPGQSGRGKHGSQADDTVWFAHNRVLPRKILGWDYTVSSRPGDVTALCPG